MNAALLSIPETTLAQLGGASRLALFLGARLFVGDERAVQFSIGRGAAKGINKIKITLDPCDTYTVEFYKLNMRKVECKLVASREDVYADSLRDVIRNVTGMFF